MASPSPPSPHHAVLFPFMSKGHTIPLLQLARLLLRRCITVTVITTPANHPFISHSLSDTKASIVDIPFPENVPDVPAGVESTDKLPSISLFIPFAIATKLMQPHFEKTLQSLLPVSFLISDGFLGWTVESASKFGIPRLVFDGTSAYFMAVSRDVYVHRLLRQPIPHDVPFTVPTFPWIKLTRNDFEPPFGDIEPSGPLFDLVVEQVVTTAKSQGVIVNSFYELEPAFVDYWNRACEPKAWSVGPLCLAVPLVPPPTTVEKPDYMRWLDSELAEGKPVLYVAFGSQAEISREQFREIATGLEESEMSFLWVVRKKDFEMFVVADATFEERVKERGMIVREWVDQREILGHEGVKGFLSHCGWNSVVESMCAGVPVLAWPMMAEQHLNARMVVEEIGVGVRVEHCDGGVRGFVKGEGLKRSVRKLMEGEKGKDVRKKAEEIAAAARKAMEEGGSSYQMLDQLILHTCKLSTDTGSG
ncbi:UDP-glycosyltransferase 90A1-like [Malania oleifera]|uniref:UDP-glycosyltransferase 90A1-like n=1 Tax=Malania oleifera TaxID=397392 RepID=UPI0025AE00CF|nr:UDP-glycosyltransferase 90A1-like [Malania oleifera]